MTPNRAFEQTKSKFLGKNEPSFVSETAFFLKQIFKISFKKFFFFFPHQVDGQQKLLVGNLGAMEKMLELIKDRVQSGLTSLHLFLRDPDHSCFVAAFKRTRHSDLKIFRIK